MIQDLEKTLASQWRSWFGSEAPGRFYYMKILETDHSGDGVAFLVFAGTERCPRVIARLSPPRPGAPSLQQGDGSRNETVSRQEALPETQQLLWTGFTTNGWSLSIHMVDSNTGPRKAGA